MSKREDIQNELVEFISEMNNSAGYKKFNAPYGILPDLTEVKNGRKARTITFGICRTLDATIWIWSHNNFMIQAAGPLSPHIEGYYSSIDEVKKVLEEI